MVHLAFSPSSLETDSMTWHGKANKRYCCAAEQSSLSTLISPQFNCDVVQRSLNSAVDKMSDGVPADRKNVAFMNTGNGDDSLTPASSGSVRQKWIARANHHRTSLNEAQIDSRASRHAQIIRRPRARGFSHVPSASWEEASGDQGVLLTSISHSSKGSGGDREERSTDNIPKQLGRLSLFVDLVWVGIIANLSATFSKQVYLSLDLMIFPLPCCCEPYDMNYVSTRFPT